MEMAWLQQDAGPELEAAHSVAEKLRSALDSVEVKGALSKIPAIGGTSHMVDEIIRPHAERFGFTSQKTTLFSEYPVALRPDWYLPLKSSGVILEVERGKTVTNNMDLLDLWKCHICREADHLILIVPVTVVRTNGIERVYERVVTRLTTFFAAGNETTVSSVAILGYR